jgi:hypothetical protein
MRALVWAIACAALAAALVAIGCKRTSSDGCAQLFGNPNALTGLTTDQCRPTCSCNGVAFTPPVYDAAFIQSLVDDWQPAQPYAPLTSDPYASPAPADDSPGTVCAILEGDATVHPRPYTLATYPSLDAATAAGAHPTHYGHCGVCSTLANLAVYMRENDLTKPVRACALIDATDGDSDPDLTCLMGLGFDLPCAQIWEYNTNHTRAECLQPCLASFTDPYNLPDGALNSCLQCDEDQSGPVFKAVAGRTRRNSGLPNAICRPCSEVQPLVHSY